MMLLIAQVEGAISTLKSIRFSKWMLLAVESTGEMQV